MIEYTVKEWYRNDKLHREDGPAVEWVDGSKFWMLDDKYYREDGPACEYADGYKSWFINGERHRVDGPAVEYPDGEKLWYLNGKGLTKEEFNRRMKKHTIEIDGKTIEISEDSYQKMKESLTSES